MIEALKKMYQLLLTEPHAPAVCDQLEVILRQAIAKLESQEPVAHWSDCAVHSEPAYPKGECDCGGYTHPPRRTEQGDRHD